MTSPERLTWWVTQAACIFPLLSSHSLRSFKLFILAIQTKHTLVSVKIQGLSDVLPFFPNCILVLTVHTVLHKESIDSFSHPLYIYMVYFHCPE